VGEGCWYGSQSQILDSMIDVQGISKLAPKIPEVLTVL
jgi:hypothetical protein